MALTRCLLPPLLAALTGCVSVSTADGSRLRLTSDEFRAYVERVFREQNRVADAVAFALDEPGAAPDLAAAEQRLLDACAGVNELATAQRDEQRLGVRRSASAARTVPQCEAATRAVSAKLAQDGAQP